VQRLACHADPDVEAALADMPPDGACLDLAFRAVHAPEALLATLRAKRDAPTRPQLVLTGTTGLSLARLATTRLAALDLSYAALDTPDAPQHLLALLRASLSDLERLDLSFVRAPRGFLPALLALLAQDPHCPLAALNLSGWALEPAADLELLHGLARLASLHLDAAVLQEGHVGALARLLRRTRSLARVSVRLATPALAETVADALAACGVPRLALDLLDSPPAVRAVLRDHAGAIAHNIHIT
jgi:hypothetical protein